MLLTKSHLSTLLRIVSMGCVLCWLAAGCALLQVREESETIYDSTILVGLVTSAVASANAPVVVAASAKTGAQRDIAHYTVLHEPGPYELIVPRGKYYIFAFADTNRDLTYQPDEPAGHYGEQTLSVDRAGGVVTNLNIVLNRPGGGNIDFPAGAAVTPDRPARVHYTSPGVVASLDDPLFDGENGGKGYWQPLEFFKEFGGNIYFLDEYDPAKIPILFVHGATGTPAGWKDLLANIDLQRFQPWFYYYPSGASIKSMADLLFWKFLNLQARYQFKEVYLAAHSMGGLVVRSFLVDYGQQFPSISKFISISTPWSGDSLSEYGVKYSPGVIPAWKDMGPQSEFAQSIYRKTLPAGIDYYLFFGHRGNRNPLRDNNDGVVTLATQLDPRAQAEAKMVCGFDEDHTSILASKQLATLFSTVINARPKGQETTAGGASGMLKVDISYASLAEKPGNWPVLYLSPADRKAAGSGGDIAVNLTAADNGRALGPFPAGDYQVSIYADAFRARPGRQLVSLRTQGEAAVGFELIPEGSVTGYVQRKFYNDGDPAGVFMLPGSDVAIQSIRLSGKGVARVLVPVQEEKFSPLDSYRAGKDWAYKTAFAFYNVPRGNYLVTIDAGGYKQYREQRVVVPGQSNGVKGIVLTPLK